MKLSAERKAAMQLGRKNARDVNLHCATQMLLPEQRESVCDIPPTQRNVFLRAFGGSKAAAIKAKCLDCSCYQRVEVAKCPAKSCPLWIVRPYQGGGEA